VLAETIAQESVTVRSSGDRAATCSSQPARRGLRALNHVRSTLGSSRAVGLQNQCVAVAVEATEAFNPGESLSGLKQQTGIESTHLANHLRRS
jgi:hypothetical protein